MDGQSYVPANFQTDQLLDHLRTISSSLEILFPILELFKERKYHENVYYTVGDNGELTYRELTAKAIEKALLGMGEPLYNVIVQRLEKQYRCQLSDCYEHPEYINEILNDLYGDAHRSVVKSINKDLDKVRGPTIERFLTVINQ
jgi:hypothetical protein